MQLAIESGISERSCAARVALTIEKLEAAAQATEGGNFRAAAPLAVALSTLLQNCLTSQLAPTARDRLLDAVVRIAANLLAAAPGSKGVARTSLSLAQLVVQWSFSPDGRDAQVIERCALQVKLVQANLEAGWCRHRLSLQDAPEAHEPPLRVTVH